MASTVIQLVPVNKLTTGWALSQSEAADLGAYKSLGIQFQVLTPGTGTGGEKLELTHSATIDGE
ncbi:MAG: hypothetical protein D6798_04640 [Deltaproteobacteria bacterium]|nr:MAG: hypothetical protein D6798_04640 [Deltaproteobacteria bacterium]